MAQLRILIFLFLGGFSSVWSIQEIAIQDIDATFQGKEVILKGFLHRDQNHIAYLTLEPNVRSCCLGSGRKAHEQVVLGSCIARTGSGLVRVLGRLEIGDGYRLDQARLVPRTKESFPWMTVSLMFFCTGVGGFFVLSTLKKTKI